MINRARNTAAKYLDQLVKLGWLIREKLWKRSSSAATAAGTTGQALECPDFLLGKPVRTRGVSELLKF